MRTYFYRTPGWFKRLGPNYVWNLNDDQETIYLTFDDGPNPGATPWVMDLLAKYNAKATFFVVGENVDRFPGIARELVDEEHEIGNHTHNHVSGWGQSNAYYLNNVQKGQAAIEHVCGVTPRYFRPPYGRIRPSQGKKVLEQFEIIMWSLLSGDFDRGLNVPGAVANLSGALAGDILVFHDNDRYLDNLRRVLPQVLERLSQAGFKFATL